ncbi:hypothetical protein SAICODRAFT_6124 [Saitoella complicata NRRL Y-17804]|uniref:Microtubule associated protein n=1 Tax=Saitoella complicata (strain BCRC 22490 / CBS 7301 / JCM 7358 / NBRC 10748 / NRRL Y-17804) TaxID=698492 RepID=A0A0E9N7L3_SAICN|nr:uncharacterized protein SAICODRAFT_6124 [Saitoella complicata NRRL Y-17804]ODQ54365.1 hypothetical protein SAICODRAFT_6124 [Saitoella complicata NRRL Y-17804]GAO45824.1 hypothetical protein G7K_0073-t1 [Saitoella complicata NRRL Y-17804]
MDWQKLFSALEESYSNLTTLQDRLGATDGEKTARNEDILNALSSTFQKHVDELQSECAVIESECQTLVKSMMDMNLEMGNTGPGRDEDVFGSADIGVEVKGPLRQALRVFEIEHKKIAEVHTERVEVVDLLYKQLDTFSGYLAPSFVNFQPSTTPYEDLSLARISFLESEVARCSLELNRRRTRIQSLAKEIVGLWTDLGTEVREIGVEFDIRILDCWKDRAEDLGVGESDVQRLEMKRDQLARQKEERRQRLDELKAAIEPLWAKLALPEEGIQAFTRSHRGFSLTVIEGYELEYRRLEELKRQNIHLFVKDCRRQLETLWEQLYFSDEENNEFEPAFTDIFTDASLAAHEGEVQRLEQLYEANAPIYALISQHEALVAEKHALDEAQKDSSRLLAKGPKRVNLLEEERQRKRLEKMLPKVEGELREALAAYEVEHRRVFMVRGERYLDVLGTEQHAAKVDKRLRALAAPASTGSAPSTPRKTAPRGVMGTPSGKTPATVRRLETKPVTAGRTVGTSMLRQAFDHRGPSPSKSRTLTDRDINARPGSGHGHVRTQSALSGKLTAGLRAPGVTGTMRRVVSSPDKVPTQIPNFVREPPPKMVFDREQDMRSMRTPSSSTSRTSVESDAFPRSGDALEEIHEGDLTMTSEWDDEGF